MNKSPLKSQPRSGSQKATWSCAWPGVGGELMERALDRARSLDAGGVCLSVLEANSGARRFYERFGFRLVRTSRDEIAPGVEITHAHYELQWRETDAGPGPGDAVAPIVAPPTVPGSRAT